MLKSFFSYDICLDLDVCIKKRDGSSRILSLLQLMAIIRQFLAVPATVTNCAPVFVAAAAVDCHTKAIINCNKDKSCCSRPCCSCCQTEGGENR